MDGWVLVEVKSLPIIIIYLIYFVFQLFIYRMLFFLLENHREIWRKSRYSIFMVLKLRFLIFINFLFL